MLGLLILILLAAVVGAVCQVLTRTLRDRLDHPGPGGPDRSHGDGRSYGDDRGDRAEHPVPRLRPAPG